MLKFLYGKKVFETCRIQPDPQPTMSQMLGVEFLEGLSHESADGHLLGAQSFH